MPPSTHYLNLLNLNPPAAVESDGFTQEDIQRELEMFTNSQFLDDNALFDGYDGFTQQPLVHTDSSHPVSPATAASNDVKPEPRQFLPTNVGMPYQMPHPVDFGAQMYPIQPIDVHMQLNPQHQPQHQQHGSTQSQPLPQSLGIKRKAEDVEDDDEGTGGRTVEEEDKRRRNTAASARFRIKKKQREQALQESAKQMTEKCTALESRVKELELENKWLRSLLKPVDAKQASTVMSTLKGQVLGHAK